MFVHVLAVKNTDSAWLRLIGCYKGLLEVELSQHHSPPLGLIFNSPDGCAIFICVIYQRHSESLHCHSVMGCILTACYDIENVHQIVVVKREFVKHYELD